MSYAQRDTSREAGAQESYAGLTRAAGVGPKGNGRESGEGGVSKGVQVRETTGGLARTEGARLRTVAGLVIAGVVLLAAACSSDQRSPEERACANLASLAPCTVGATDEEACVDSFLENRAEFHGDGECRAEYDAYLACVTSLTSCPTGDGAVCPAEVSALGLCGRP